MEASDTQADAAVQEETQTDDEYVLDGIDMILSNYRGIVIEREGAFTGRHLEDILKAFALYLYGDGLKRVSLMPPETADAKLFEAVSGKGLKLDAGFHSWKSVSTVLQGLQMMSMRIGAPLLVKAFTRFATKLSMGRDRMYEMESVIILSDNVNGLVSEMVISNEVLMPWYMLSTFGTLGKDRDVIVSDNRGGDLKRLTMLMMGAQCIDRGNTSSPLPNDGNRSRDAVLFIDSMPRLDENGLIRWVMDSLPENGVLVLITMSSFFARSDIKAAETRRYLEGFRIECQYKLRNGLMNFGIPLYITKIVKSMPGGETKLYDQIEDLECTIDQSEFDWDLEGLMHRDDFGEFRTVPLIEAGDIRRGVIIPKDCLTEEDPEGRPVYIRPMDARDGYIKDRRKMLSITTDKYPLLEPGTMLIHTLGGAGKTVLIEEDDTPCVANASFQVFRPNGTYTEDYLLAYFDSSYFIAQATHYSSSYSNALTTRKLSEMRMPYADDRQQKEIGRRYMALRKRNPEKVWEIFRDVLKI